MTVADDGNIKQYTGNGVTSVFSTGDVVFYDETDLIVTETVISTGVDTLLTLTTDYTVSGGNGSAGSITLVAGALPSTKRITIQRSIPYVQTDDYVEGENILSETIETAFDKAVIRDQQLRDDVNKSLKFSPTLSPSLVGIITETPINEFMLVWDGVTGAVKNGISITNFTDIAGIASEIAIVAGISSDVTAVAADVTDIGIVATNITSVNTTANNITDIIIAAGLVTGFLASNNVWTGTNIFQGVVDVTNVNAEGSGGGNLRTNGGTNCLSWGAGGSANLTAGGNLSMNTTHKIVNMADPSSDQDAATKKYVDDEIAAIPSITIGTMQTASGDQVDFSVPSGVKRVKIMFKNISLSGTASLSMQLGDSGGIETSGYAGVCVGSQTSSAATSATAHFTLVGSGFQAAALDVHGTITLDLMDAATNLWALSGVIAMTNWPACSMIAGTKALSSELTTIRINDTGTNTFDAGQINISYQ